MIYTVGTKKLNIPETGTTRKSRTPRQVVPWRDVAETCRTLDVICKHIPLDKNKKIKIVDGIARAGFWGAVFQNHWPKCKLVLNEEDEKCNPALAVNYPKTLIINKNIHKWTPPISDISLLDFDHFTLRILNQWKDVLTRWSPKAKYFIIADGACFGFKFGNMKHYNIEHPEEYYYLLDKAIYKIIGKHITVVSAFINASTILLEDKKPRKIKYEPPSNLFLSRGCKIYKINKEKKRSSLL